MPEEEVVDDLDARNKVAILMIALGQETTAEVMKYLSDMEIEQIAQAIAELDVVTTEQEDDVLEEFEQLLMAGKYVSQGGIDFARGALEKAMLYERMQRQISEISTLAEVSETITSPLYLDEMLELIVDMAARVMRAKACSLMLLDGEQSVLVLRATQGFSSAAGHRYGTSAT